MIISVEDKGISIPLSIQQKIPENKRLKNVSDSELITNAIGFITFPGRGLGLKSIINNIESGTLKSLSIFSRNGYFSYSPKLQSPKRFVTEDFSGTCIEVTIPDTREVI